MKKNIKRIISIMCIVVLCSSSIAAVVSDNDGAAFITKAEFDSLKNTFQTELNKYNSEIGDKVDAVIASYLAGVKKSNISTLSPVLNGDVYMFDNTNASTRMRYVYGPPYIYGSGQVGQWNNNATYGCMAVMSIGVNTASNHNTSNWWQTKLVISDIDTTKNIAAWKGRYVKAYDGVNVTYTNLAFDSINWGGPMSYAQLVRSNSGNGCLYINTDLYGKTIFGIYFLAAKDNEGVSTGSLQINSITNTWGNVNNKNTFLLGNSINYDCFSNYDGNRNWRYNGSSETLYQTINNSSNTLSYLSKVFITSSTTFNVVYGDGHVVDGAWRVPGDGAKTNTSVTLCTNPYWSTASSRTDSRWYDGDLWRYPGVGFEKTYITNWNQLYLPDLDSFANMCVEDKVKGYGSLQQSSDGNYHIPMYAGLPLIQVEKGNKVEFDFVVHTYSLNTTASDSNYGKETRSNPSTTYIWAKSSPFTTNDPNSEADLLITGTNVKKSTSTAYNKGVYINSTKETIQIEGIKDNCCVWLKWSTNSKNGGGVVTIPNQVTVVSEG